MISPASYLTDLPRRHFRAILADPPWRFRTWSEAGRDRSPDRHYNILDVAEIKTLPVSYVAAADCALFLWATWPMINDAFDVIETWGFRYKTCGFLWTKADADLVPFKGLGYWTRANTEPCLLATRGKPKRKHADVPQAIIEPRREHSRKPDCVHAHIKRLVRGPYLELFARQTRAGWTSWGNETHKFDRMEAAE
jgi:N6-adenosine-specific RNA methylase IME4